VSQVLKIVATTDAGSASLTSTDTAASGENSRGGGRRGGVQDAPSIRLGDSITFSPAPATSNHGRTFRPASGHSPQEQSIQALPHPSEERGGQYGRVTCDAAKVSEFPSGIAPVARATMRA